MCERHVAHAENFMGLLTPPVSPKSEAERRESGRSFLEKPSGLATPPSSSQKPLRQLRACSNNGNCLPETSFILALGRGDENLVPLTVRKTSDLQLKSTNPSPVSLDAEVQPAPLGNLDGETAEQKKQDREVESTPDTSQIPLSRRLDKYLNHRLRPSQRPASSRRPSPVTPTQSPDRFTIPRRAPNVSREILIVGKPISSLKQREKVRRRRSSHSDPFGFPQRAENRSSEPPRALRSQRPLQPSHLRSPDVLGPRRDPFLNSMRQISAGAVWNVGGGAASSDPSVSAGGGRVNANMQSSSAPLYTSRFLEGSTPGTDFEMHERRIALALGLDRAKRVLASVPSASDMVNMSPTVADGSSCSSTTLSALSDDHRCKITWTINGWTRACCSGRKSHLTRTVDFS